MSLNQFLSYVYEFSTDLIKYKKIMESYRDDKETSQAEKKLCEEIIIRINALDFDTGVLSNLVYHKIENRTVLDLMEKAQQAIDNKLLTIDELDEFLTRKC